jgi:hypothetical protein
MTEREEALTWAGAQLANVGLPLTGEPEVVKDRSWSLVARLPTKVGDCWLKVNRGGTTYEPVVLDLLARVAPESVLHPLALDLARGWSLTPDGGSTLRSSWGDLGPDPAVLGRVLHEYAQLQRATADHTVELLTAGVPDLRPEALPAALDDLLDEADWSVLTGGEDPDATARARVMAHRGAFARQCIELARRSTDAGIPMALQHDDLHDNNVFVARTGGGSTYRVFDWGDSCVSHPFGTLLVALRSFAARRGLEPDALEVRQVRDAYLSAWSDLAPPEDLVAMADLAVAVGPVTRAHSWRNALVEAKAEEQDDYGDAVPGWLAELVPRTPLSGSVR